MKTQRGIAGVGLALAASALLAFAAAPARANGHSGGFGGHAAVGHGYAGHGYFGHGYGYGYGYGYRGWGGWGWRGYGYYGCCGWWGWPGYGLFLATLPLYYSTLWWDGVPYYYAYNNYYVWDGAAGGYVAVSPPPEVASQVNSAPGALSAAGTPPAGGPGSELFAYPRNGQSTEQQQRDRQECRDWAASQASGNHQNELRAQTACLEGRGYSVR